MKKCQFSWIGKFLHNKRDLRADGLPLQPSALRPRLLCRTGKPINYTAFLRFFIHNRGEQSLNVVKIVVMTTILSGSGLFSFISSNSVFADSLTLTISSSQLSLNLNPSVNNGFATTSGSFNVKTDNASGYTLSIRAKDSENSNSLLNGSNKLNSITEQTNEDLFKSDSKFNNTWGYLPSKFNSLDNTDFLPGPNMEDSVLDTTKEANSATGTDYSITIGAKVDDAVLVGNYSNEFIINAVTNAPIKYLQDFTADDCAALIQDDGNNTEDMAVTLTDKRDGNEYRVGKLADGKCWMLQGLRIMDKNISSADSDMLDSDGTFKVPSSDIAKFVSSDNNNSAAYYYEDNEDDSGYYTWYTATAGTGTTEVANTDAPSSICPKGWRMPKSGPGGSDTSELVTLLKAYGGSGNDGMGQQDIIDKLIKPSFPNYGYVGSINYSNGVLTDFGDIGYYWSSTAYSAGDAYGIYYKHSATNLKPGDHGVKRRGRPVRCVFDIAPEPKKITDLQYLQDFGDLNDEEKTQVFNSMQDETNYTLTDERDNTQYTIAKLKDGKVWMTENLRITGSSSFQPGHSKTLKSNDSDLPDGITYTLPTSATWTAQYTAINIDRAYYSDNENYGAYYTWYTATAGTGASMGTEGQNASGSICPKGWRLPTGGSSSNADFQLLTKQYTNGAQLVATPTPAFTYAGNLNYNNGSLDSQGKSANYWSSTVRGTIAYLDWTVPDSYNLDFSSSFFAPANSSGRPFGFSVRCVAR